jgi:hypothetical protein
MDKNIIINPQDIVQKFSARLKGKQSELEYLLYMDKQFEKWLQYELVLAMSDDAIPVIYNSDIEVKYEGENVCEIATEYSIPDGRSCDILIAERPFLSKYVNEDWQMIDNSSIKECIELYSKKTFFHYVELKQINWSDINTLDSKINYIVEDFIRYSNLDWRTFKTYLPRSIISICFISFWNKKFPSKVVSSTEVAKASDRIHEYVKDKCDKQFQMKSSFLSPVKITDEIHLISTYYYFDK